MTLSLFVITVLEHSRINGSKASILKCYFNISHVASVLMFHHCIIDWMISLADEWMFRFRRWTERWCRIRWTKWFDPQQLDESPNRDCPTRRHPPPEATSSLNSTSNSPLPSPMRRRRNCNRSYLDCRLWMDWVFPPSRLPFIVLDPSALHRPLLVRFERPRSIC